MIQYLPRAFQLGRVTVAKRLKRDLKVKPSFFCVVRFSGFILPMLRHARIDIRLNVFLAKRQFLSKNTRARLNDKVSKIVCQV